MSQTLLPLYCYPDRRNAAGDRGLSVVTGGGETHAAITISLPHAHPGRVCRPETGMELTKRTAPARAALGATPGGQLSKNGIQVGHGAVARTWMQRAVRTVRTVLAGIFQWITADACWGHSCPHAVRAVRA